MVKAFEESTGKKVNYKIVERRAGDIATCYSDPQKAKNELHWEATKTLNDMCKDSWKYIQNRKDGKDKKQAVSEALGTSINSIIVSGLCFFGATFGVGAYSKIEMIGSLCTLMSRGAIISVIVVITVLPAFLMIFDKLVCKTTIGMREVKN